jgi:isopentenyl-diphosphate delta-isomerase
MEQQQDHKERVILVDEKDREIGVCGKIECHERGLLHRAFSIFLFAPDGSTLVQRRALSKYHSGGKWANACCGHPRLGESVEDAANRRLEEELGMRADLTEAFHIRYSANVSKDMVENEYVHVFVGLEGETPKPNPFEVSEVAYCQLDDLKNGDTIDIDMQTAWLRRYIVDYYEKLRDSCLPLIKKS